MVGFAAIKRRPLFNKAVKQGSRCKRSFLLHFNYHTCSIETRQGGGEEIQALMASSHCKLTAALQVDTEEHLAAKSQIFPSGGGGDST